MNLGTQARIREIIIIEVMQEYVNEKKDSDIFCLSDVKRRVNLYEQDVEVAIRDLREMGVIEVASGYAQTSTPYYQFVEGATPKPSTKWIPGQGWWQQRDSRNGKDGWIMWYGGHPNLHCKYYHMT